MNPRRDERCWDVLIVDWREHPVADPHPFQEELLRRGLRVKLLMKPFPAEPDLWLIREFQDAAYVLMLATEGSGDGQKEHTSFQGRPLIGGRPWGRVPDPAGFDPEVGGEEHGVLEEDGPVLVERLTLWAKSWNR